MDDVRQNDRDVRQPDGADLPAQATLMERAALLGGATKWTTHALTGAGVPAMTLADGPHGVRRETDDASADGDAAASNAAASDGNAQTGLNPSHPATCFPTASIVACSWDPQLATLMGTTIAREARAQGVNVLLGPGMNVKRSPLCGRNFEYYAEDPQLAGHMAAGFIDGVQSQGVAACPKHFAANGQELRRQCSDSVMDERTLRELYLTAFEIAVRAAHPWAIMASYNRVNGTYAFENRHLLTGILRDEWGFDGMVVSDWGASNDAVAAAEAGGSLEMPCPGLSSVRELMKAVDDGRLGEATLTARAREVARCAARTHADDDAHASAAGVDDGDVTKPTVAASHHRLACRVAEESAVLLRNEAPSAAVDPVLPLPAGTRVALVGDMAAHPRIQGGGSSRVNATRVESLRDVLESASEGALRTVAYAQGYRADGAADATLIDEAAALADRADVDAIVACVGLDDRSEAEGIDRSTLAMPQPQNDLMAALGEAAHRAGKPLVVVLASGSPVLLPWAESCDAILYMGLGGQAVARAAARLLAGIVPPAGRLAETWPLADEDMPVDDYPAAGPEVVYAEGMHVGYRHYVTDGVPVRFPFGFGLSTTRFEYSGLTVDATGATFTVANAGPRAGVAVPQLYVAGRAGDVARELRGFAKVRLAAGESTRVTLPFDRYTFRRWDESTGMWRDDALGRTVIVGEGCLDARLTGTTPGSEASEALRVLEGTARLSVDERALARAERTAGNDGQAGAEDAAAGAAGAGAGAAGAGARPAASGVGAASEASDASGDAPVFTVNSPFSGWSASRSPVARWWARRLEREAREAQERNGGAPDLDSLFRLNMPPRALAKLSDGAFDAAAARSLASVANGRTIRGLIGFVWHTLRNRLANRRTRRRLERLGVK